jgi:hypothetical protein
MSKIFWIFLLVFFNCLLLSSQSLLFNWGKHLKSSAGVSKINSSATDSLNNIYVTGFFSGTVDLDTTSAITDIISFGSSNANCFIAKYSSSGNLVWAKVISSSVSSVGLSVAVDRSKNIYLTGSFEGMADFDPSPVSSYNLSTSPGTTKMFLTKLNNSGNFLWTQAIGGANSFGNAVETDTTGNVFVSGYFPGKYILSKYDALGNVVWENDFPQAFFSDLSSLTVDASNDIYFSLSYFDSIPLISFSSIDTTLFSKGARDIALIKYSNNGNFLWTNQLGGTGDDIVRANSIDSKGDVIISGIFGDTMNVNPSGAANYLYQNGTEAPAFLCKYNQNGILVWAKKITASTFLTPPFPVLSSNGDVYISGNFSDSIYFDSLLVYSKLVSSATPGYFDIFLSKYDSNGNFVDAQQIGGSANNAPWEISMDIDDNLILVGSFDGLFDVNPSIGFNPFFNPTANGAGYVVKYAPPTNGIAFNRKPTLEINSFPNPFNQEVQINFSGLDFSGIVNVYDAKGMIQDSYSVKNKRSIVIKTNDWAVGFYFLKAVNTDEEIQYTKLIKCN